MKETDPPRDGTRYAVGVLAVVAVAGIYALMYCTTSVPRTVVPIPMDDAAAATFFAGDWFVQWQTETRYLKSAYNTRVKATYTPRPPSWFGYTVGVHNVAEAAGIVRDSNWNGLTLLGAQRHPDSNGLAKFVVAPQFLPRWFAGDYWIIARAFCGTTEEFAVVCGGQPTVADGDAYTYDTDATNNSGLWIFTRSRNPVEIVSIYKIASAVIHKNGISLTGLNRVDQTDRKIGPKGVSS
jgi:hypothetical protein